MTSLVERTRLMAPEAQGAALVLLATTLFVTMDSVAKLMTERFDPMQVVWARYTGQAMLVGLMVAPRLRTVLRTGSLGLQLVRSAFFFGATINAFFAFAVLPLATVTAVFQVAPLAITALAALTLGEQVGPRRWLGVAVGFAGALVIIRPGSAVFEPAALLPLMGALCFAGYAITTRVLGQRDGVWTTYLYSAVVGTVLSSLWLPMVWRTPSLLEAAALLGMASIGTLGHLVLVAAFARAEASALAPFTYFGLIMAAVLGYLVFGDVPDGATLVGAGVIVGSGLYVWHRERLRTAPPTGDA